jgi:hypothetical protein
LPPALTSRRGDVTGLHSKSYTAELAAPVPDFEATVCDPAAGETCPCGRAADDRQLNTPDSAVATGSPADVTIAFKDAYRIFDQRSSLRGVAAAVASLRPADQIGQLRSPPGEKATTRYEKSL